ncbi:MAG TPA: amino acid racemase [Verrucomicrobiaceae bacterium]|jgi:aspartate racemase
MRRILHVAVVFVASAILSRVQAADPAPKHLLGIFGGMGPEATANLYAEIVRLTPASRDQDHIPTLIYSFPQVPDRTTSIQAGDPSIIPYLVEGVTRLEKAGASFIVIPCNTAHHYYDDMQRAVKIPIVHMIRETVDAVVKLHPDCKSAGLLATSGTIQSKLYEDEFLKQHIAVVHPDEAIQSTCVMKAVIGIKAGGDKRELSDLLFTAGRDVEKKGAQIIVLGCTEIPLAFDTSRATVPVVNATRVLAEAAIREFERLKK